MLLLIVTTLHTDADRRVTMHYDSEPSFSDLPLKMRHRVEIISRAVLGCLFIDLTNKQESTRQFIKDLVFLSAFLCCLICIR